MSRSKRISILGVTGSVGESTLRVIEEARAQGDDLEVEAICCGEDVAALAQAAARLQPKFCAVASPDRLEDLRGALKAAGVEAECGAGPAAILETAAREADWVMAAIVGAAGLEPTLAAIDRGAQVALANKEALVCAGALMTAAAERSGARLLPVDSEHNAIFQVWETPRRAERVTLTASGGPFRSQSLAHMAAAGPEEACRHPTWSMGAKISVDSATLMNKGLELIEAMHLFALREDEIDILVHPQSIIHSLVHYPDGSVLAQLSDPDMRVPIAYALAWPHRMRVSTPRLDLARVGALTFEAPDPERFPALTLTRAAARAGDGATAGLNAANEIAVEAFLAKRIGFLDICRVNEQALEALTCGALAAIAKSPSSLDQVRAIDAAARDLAREATRRIAATR